MYGRSWKNIGWKLKEYWMEVGRIVGGSWKILVGGSWKNILAEAGRIWGSSWNNFGGSWKNSRRKLED
jgi:hypothetical protein